LPAIVLGPVGQETVSPRSTQSTQVSERKIMVVDDNSDAAEMLTALLEHMGFRVAAAADGPSALETARVFEPDVALLDLGLPVMDGMN